MAIAEQILAAQQHLDTAVGQCLAKFPQTFPRIFFQEAHAASKVAPPHASTDQKPMLSSLWQMGSMSSVRMRVAITD